MVEILLVGFQSERQTEREERVGLLCLPAYPWDEKVCVITDFLTATIFS